jgi:hypothetical protein
MGVDSFFVAEERVLLDGLGLDQIEGVGEQFVRLAGSSAVKLALDSLLEVVIKGDGHGMSIRR